MAEKNPFRTGPSDKHRETRQNPESSQNPGERFLAAALEQARRRQECGELSDAENIQRIQKGIEGQLQRETGESSSTEQKDLSVQEYIDKLKDDPERKERFIKKLEGAIEGRKRLERVVETASPDVQYVLLSESGAEVRAIFAGLKPASFGGIVLKLRTYLDSQYNTYSEEKGRILIADMASLARKTGTHIVAQDPAHDFRMIDPYGPRSLYRPIPNAPFLPSPGEIHYSLDSTSRLFQEYPGTFGSNHSDSAIEVVFYRTAVPQSERSKEHEKEDLNLKAGLLCGIPYDAAVWHSTRNSSDRGENVGRDLTGLAFVCKSREEKSIKEYIEDYKAVIKYSGINNIHRSLFIENVDSDNPFSTFHAMRELIEHDLDNPFSNVYAPDDRSSNSSLDGAKGSKESIKGEHDNPFSDDNSSSDDNPFKD